MPDLIQLGADFSRAIEQVDLIAKAFDSLNIKAQELKKGFLTVNPAGQIVGATLEYLSTTSDTVVAKLGKVKDATGKVVDQFGLTGLAVSNSTKSFDSQIREFERLGAAALKVTKFGGRTDIVPKLKEDESFEKFLVGNVEAVKRAGPKIRAEYEKQIQGILEFGARSGLGFEEIAKAAKIAFGKSGDITERLYGNTKTLVDKFQQLKLVLLDIGRTKLPEPTQFHKIKLPDFDLGDVTGIVRPQLERVKALFETIRPQLKLVDKDTFATGTEAELAASKAALTEFRNFLLNNSQIGKQAVKGIFKAVREGTTENLPTAQQQFIQLLNAVNNANSRIGESARQAAAIEKAARDEIIVKVRQVKNAYDDEAAAIARRNQIAVDITKFAQAQSPLPLDTSKIPEARLKSYFSNLATITSQARETTLSLEQLQQVFNSFDNIKLIADLSPQQLAFRTAVDTFRGAYLNLNKEVEKQGTIASTSGRLHIDALNQVIAKARQAANTITELGEQESREAQTRQSLKNTFFDVLAQRQQLPPLTGIDTTAYTSSITKLANILDTTEVKAERLFKILTLPLTTDTLTVLTVEERKFAEAILASDKAAASLRDDLSKYSRQNIAAIQAEINKLNERANVTKYGGGGGLVPPPPTGGFGSFEEEFRDAQRRLGDATQRFLAIQKQAFLQTFRDIKLPETRTTADIENVRGAIDRLSRSWDTNIKKVEDYDALVAHLKAPGQIPTGIREGAEPIILRGTLENLPPKFEAIRSAATGVEKAIVQSFRNESQAAKQLAIANDEVNQSYKAAVEVSKIDEAAIAAFARRNVQAARQAATELIRRGFGEGPDLSLQFTGAPDKLRDRFTNIANQIVESFAKAKGRTSESLKDLEQAFTLVGSGKQLVGLENKLGGLYPLVVKLVRVAAELDSVFAKTTGSATELARATVIEDFSKRFKIDPTALSDLERILKRVGEGRPFTALTDDLGILQSKIIALRAEVKKVDGSFDDEKKQVLRAAAEEIKAIEDIARKEAERERREDERRTRRRGRAEVEATRQRAELDKATAERFPEVEKIFASKIKELPLFITPQKREQVRQALIELTRESINSKISVDDIGKAFDRVAAKAKGLTVPITPITKSPVGGFELPRGIESEKIEKSVQSLNTVFADAGRIGSNAGQSITITWQGVFRLFQAQVLHTTLSQFLSDIRQAITESGEFSKQIALIRTISQDAAASFDQWASSIRHVSDQLGLPVTDVAKGAYDALSNQVVTTREETERFALVAGNLAKVTGGTTEEAVSVLSSQIRSFGGGADSADEKAAALFATIDKGRVRLSELSTNMGRNTAFAKQLGLGYKDLDAALVVLTQVGIKSSDAQTQLNAVMAKLIRPTQEGEKALKALGYESGESLVRARGLGGALADLAKLSQQGEVSFSDLFNEIRSGKGGLTLAEDGAKLFGKALKDIEPDTENFRKIITEFDKTPGIHLSQELVKIHNIITHDIGQAAVGVLIHFEERFGHLSDLVVKAGNVLLVFGKVAISVAAIQLFNPFLQTGASFIGLIIDSTKHMNILRATQTAFAAEASLLGTRLGGVLFKFAPLLAFIAGYELVDKVIFAARRREEELAQEFKRTSEAGVESANEITKAFSEASQRQVDVVKANVDRMVSEYARASSVARKELQKQLDFAEENLKDISGHVESVFKATSENLKRGADKLKQAGDDAAKAQERIRADQRADIQENQKMLFEHQKALYPQQTGALSIQRATQLFSEANQDLLGGREGESQAKIKEARKLIDDLSTVSDKATAVARRTQDQQELTIRSAARSQAASASVAGLREANQAYAQRVNLADQEVDKNGKLRDVTKQNEQVRLQALKNTNALFLQTSRQQLAEQNRLATEADKSAIRRRNLLSQLSGLAPEQVARVGLDLDREHLVVQEQTLDLQAKVEAKSREQHETLTLIFAERERELGLLNKISLVDKRGEPVTPKEREKALARFAELQEHIIDLTKQAGELLSQPIALDNKPLVDREQLTKDLITLEKDLNVKFAAIQQVAGLQQTLATGKQLNDQLRTTAADTAGSLDKINRQIVQLAGSANQASQAALTLVKAFEGLRYQQGGFDFFEDAADSVEDFLDKINLFPKDLSGFSGREIKEASREAVSALQDLTKARKLDADIANLRSKQPTEEVGRDLTAKLAERSELYKKLGDAQLNASTKLDILIDRVKKLDELLGKAGAEKLGEKIIPGLNLSLSQALLDAKANLQSAAESDKQVGGLQSIIDKMEEYSRTGKITTEQIRDILKVSTQDYVIYSSEARGELGKITKEFDKLLEAQKKLQGFLIKQQPKAPPLINEEQLRQLRERAKPAPIIQQFEGQEINTPEQNAAAAERLMRERIEGLPNIPKPRTPVIDEDINNVEQKLKKLPDKKNIDVKVNTSQLGPAAQQFLGFDQVASRAIDDIVSKVNTELIPALAKVKLPQSPTPAPEAPVEEAFRGGLIRYMATGGYISTMLTPGEVVVPPNIVRGNLGPLNALNAGLKPRGTDIIPLILQSGSFVLRKGFADGGAVDTGSLASGIQAIQAGLHEDIGVGIITRYDKELAYFNTVLAKLKTQRAQAIANAERVEREKQYPYHQQGLAGGGLAATDTVPAIIQNGSFVLNRNFIPRVLGSTPQTRDNRPEIQNQSSTTIGDIHVHVPPGSSREQVANFGRELQRQIKIGRLRL